MNIAQVCEELGIPEYAERIWHSSSTGELYHVLDYHQMLEACKNAEEKLLIGRCIKIVVEWAEENWSRPESVFQDMPRMIHETFKQEAA